MLKKFKFAHVVAGEIAARNKSVAYMLVQMSVSVASRLLGSPCNVSVRVIEVDELEGLKKAQKIDLNKILAQAKKEREVTELTGEQDGSY